MTETTHRIHRQVFELSVSDTGAAKRIQGNISRLQTQSLSRDICRIFDTIAGDDTVRIDRLTVDLGTLTSDNLETELRTALQRALPKSLDQALTEQAVQGAQQKSGQGSSSTSGSARTLIEQLLTHGHLPWWADPTQRDHLTRAAQALLEAGADPRGAETLLRRLLTNPIAAERAARHLKPKALAQWVELLSPGRGREARNIIGGMVRQLPVLQRRDQTLQLWVAVLQTAASGNPSRLGFWREAITTLAESNALGLAEQLAALPVQGSAAELIKTLQSELPMPTSREADEPDLPFVSLRRKWPAVSELLGFLENILQRQPNRAALTPAIKAFCVALEAHQPAKIIPALTHLLQGLKRYRLTPSAPLAQALHLWAGQETKLDTKALTALATEQEPSTKQPAPLSRADDAAREEGLPIINGGIILFWPFLKTFFARLELLEGSHFCNPAAQEQAMGLLHYLVTGELEPPEYQLPLIKLLCGLPLSAPWQPRQRPNKNVLDECDALMDVLIARAPNLGKLSHGGLRGSFLQRKGLLHAEMDGWLLRIERETFDILLDSLPWPTSWIRLPWMSTPLQVEW